MKIKIISDGQVVLVCFFVFLVVRGPAWGKPVWQTPGIPDAAYLSKEPLSAARWIWSGPKATRNQVAYFRCRFDLKAKDGQMPRVCLQLRADDYVVAVYLNGEKVPTGDRDSSGDFQANNNRISAEHFQKAAKVGENVLALEVENGWSSAGVIYRVLDGKSVVFVSSSAVKCADKVEDGWFLPGFDETNWRAAHELGDSTVAPWARIDPSIIRSYMTQEEWTAYQGVLERAVSGLPAALASEPEPDARIVYRGWLPKIDLNGKLLEPNFSLPIALGLSPYQESAVIKLDSLGFPITRISARDVNYWKGEGKYDFSNLDWQARRLLTIAPNARMEICLGFNQMRGWCKAHPDEIVGYQTGPAEPLATDDFTQRVIRPSAASEKFREEAARVIVALGEFIRSQPWGKRAIAIRLSYGIYSEWHTYGMFHGPDSGPAMTRLFRKFLTRKYGTDAALAQAWNDPSVTLATALPPTMEERGPEEEILDEKKYRKALDFFICNANVSADTLLFMSKKTKEALPGRLVGAYYGYVFATHPPEGSNTLLDKVLSSPYVDFLSNPATYTPETRRAGGSYTLRTIPASYHRYGKLCVCEDDMRFHHSRQYEVTAAYATETAEESRATAKRDYLNRFFDGMGYQALDLSSGYRQAAFDEPSVLEGLHDAMVETEKAGDPGLNSQNDLAVVIDYRGRLKTGNKPTQNKALHARYDKAPEYLYRTGVTFDLMTLDDYLATRQAYGHVLFLNARDADSALMARARVKAGAAAFEPDGVYTSAKQYRDLFLKRGLHAWIGSGSYVRRHGDFLMFHTGTAGTHEIALPDGFTGAESLSSGRSYDGARFTVDVTSPATESFKLKRRQK